MGSKILLADDSITIQKVVNLTFVDEGIDVITVSNGEMAQRRLAEVNPDLVLADIFMPGKNGYELCQFVKDSPDFKNVPVVLLVGAFEPFDQAEARRVKADGHLTKPFESRTLVETVRNLIQTSKARRPTRPLPPPPAPSAPEPSPFELGASGGDSFHSPFDLTAHTPSGEAGGPGFATQQTWTPSATQPIEFGGLEEGFEGETGGVSFEVPGAEQGAPLPGAVASAPISVIADVRAQAGDYGYDPTAEAERVAPAEEPTLHAHRPFGNTDLDFDVTQSAQVGPHQIVVEQPAVSGGADFEVQGFDAPPSVPVSTPVEAAGFEPSEGTWGHPAGAFQGEPNQQTFQAASPDPGMHVEWQTEPAAAGVTEVVAEPQGFEVYAAEPEPVESGASGEVAPAHTTQELYPTEPYVAESYAAEHYAAEQPPAPQYSEVQAVAEHYSTEHYSDVQPVAAEHHSPEHYSEVQPAAQHYSPEHYSEVQPAAEHYSSEHYSNVQSPTEPYSPGHYSEAQPAAEAFSTGQAYSPEQVYSTEQAYSTEPTGAEHFTPTESFAASESYPAPSAYVAAEAYPPEDDPLGDILEGDENEVLPEYRDYRATSYSAESVAAASHESDASHTVGFELMTPPVVEEEHSEPATRAVQKVNGELEAEDLGTGWSQGTPMAFEAEAPGVSSVPGPGASSEARDFAYAVPETEHSEAASGFEVVASEPSSQATENEPPEHTEFFASSFAARDRLKFTSSQMWTEGQADHAASEAPGESMTEEESVAVSPTQAASHHQVEPAAHLEAHSEDLGETGFEFSQLIEEIDELETAHESEPEKAAIVPPAVEQVAASNGSASTPIETAVPGVSTVPSEPVEVHSEAHSEVHPELHLDSGGPAVSAAVTNGNVAPGLSPAAIEEIVKAVLKEMTDAVVREIAWEVVPECVERVVERLSREGLSKRP